MHRRDILHAPFEHTSLLSVARAEDGARPLRPTVALTILVGLLMAGPGFAQWVAQGPGPITEGQVEGISDQEVVGAVHCVTPHPTDADVLYIGGVNGGIWRTENAMAASPEWARQTDFQDSLSIGALEFDPTDATHRTLVAGIGRFSSFGREGGALTGLLRTTNEGVTWTPIGADLAQRSVSGIAPRGNTIVASVNFGIPFDFPFVGIFRSTDGGASFDQISQDDGIDTGLPGGVAYDLATDPGDPTRLFTSIIYASLIGGEDGVYRSTDTGATWEKVSDGAIDALLSSDFDNDGFTSNLEIVVGTSGNVFLAIVNVDVTPTRRISRLAGVFRSGDGGDTWTQMDLPEITEIGGVDFGVHPGGQGGIHLSLAADPGDPDVIYIGGDRQPFANEGTLLDGAWPNTIGAADFSGRLFRGDASQPAGSQWVHITHSDTLGPAGGGTAGDSSPHADSRDMAFAANGVLIEGDDGGVYRRTNPGSDTGDWFSMNGDLRTTEFHNVAWDTNAGVVIGGAQDVGTSAQDTPAGISWPAVDVADGGDVAVDDTGTPGFSTRYSSIQGLGLFRREVFDAANVLQTSEEPALTEQIGDDDPDWQFTTPLEINTADPLRLVFGAANAVYESLDQGDSIAQLAPDVMTNGFGEAPLGYGASDNEDILYVGGGPPPATPLDDFIFDQIWIRTTAAGNLVRSAAYPGDGSGRPVFDIAIDPADSATAFVVDDTEVYRTTTTGGAWDTLTGDLAAANPGTLRSIAFAPRGADGLLAVGADRGVFTAPGPDFDTWTELGVSLPEAPVFDLEYDAEDDLLLAGTLGRGAWVWRFTEEDPVDAMLVLDLSGSMLSPACPGCDPKLDVLKDSVEIFIRLWEDLAGPDDHLGIAYFRTDVDEFEVGGNVLVPVVGNADAMITDVRAQATVSANLTAMGGGLERAIELLDDDTRPRSVILFSDGMQNVNPMVDDDVTPKVIAQDPSISVASNIPPSMPPTALDTDLDRRVNTIAVGAGDPYVVLLGEIAAETDGVSKATLAPDADLREFYVEELVDALRGSSPQLVAYRRGSLDTGSADQAFDIGVGARKIVLKLSWSGTAKLDFSVEKDGADVTGAGTMRSTLPGRPGYYRIYSLELPAQGRLGSIEAEGRWVMKIKGSRGVDYQVAAIVDEPLLEYDFSLGGRTFTVGQAIPLEARLSLDGAALPGATVKARVYRPGQSLGTLLSTTRTPEIGRLQAEPSASGGQKKLQALLLQDRFWRDAQPTAVPGITLRDNGDGTYSASFSDATVPGAYRVVFTVEGRHPDTGDYRRTEQRTAMVRFDAADPDRSVFRVDWPSRPSDKNPVKLVLRPQDSYGNYLGPDYGHKIEVQVSPGAASRPVDLLDGSYEVALSGVDRDSTVEVEVLDKPFYEGTLEDGGYRYAWSFHAGTTDPSGGFPPGASGDQLLEIDVEYVLARRVSINAVAGHYAFDPDPDVTGLTVYLRGYAPQPGFRLFGELGLGVYDPSGLDLSPGVGAGVGIDRALAPGWRGELGIGYFQIFNDGDDLEFGVAKIGVRRTF